VSRDLIGVPYINVTTKTFLLQFGPDTLRPAAGFRGA